MDADNIWTLAAAGVAAVATITAAVVSAWTHRRLKHESEPNNGGSLRDSLDRIERREDPPSK